MAERGLVQQLPYGLYVLLDWLSIILGCIVFVCLAGYYIYKEIVIYYNSLEKKSKPIAKSDETTCTCKCQLASCEKKERLFNSKVGFKRGRSSELLLHDYIIPAWFARFAFFYGWELFWLAIAIFWESFIFNKTYSCDASPEYACFSLKPIHSSASSLALDCHNDTDVANITDLVCYKFAYRFNSGVSAVIGTVGIGASAFVTISWVILRLAKCFKKCLVGIILLCIVQGLLIVVSIVVFVTIAIVYRKSIPTENILQGAIILLAVLPAFCLPTCWMKPVAKKSGDLRGLCAFTAKNRLWAAFKCQTEFEEMLIKTAVAADQYELELGEIFYASLDNFTMEIVMEDILSKEEHWPSKHLSRYCYKVALNESVKLNIDGKQSVTLTVCVPVKTVEPTAECTHAMMLTSESIVTLVVEELEMKIKMKINDAENDHEVMSQVRATGKDLKEEEITLLVNTDN